MSKDRDYGVETCPAMGTLYAMQREFQEFLKGSSLFDVDSPNDMAESILGLLGECGEVLQADQRWKRNGRNTYYNRREKIEEIADCFIFLLNVCIYSGISSFELMNAVKDKIEKNKDRYLESRTSSANDTWKIFGANKERCLDKDEKA